MVELVSSADSHPPPAAALGLPPFDQICLVVRDLRAALALYEPLFGPFTVLANGAFPSVYRGEPVTTELKVAFGRSGSIEIELVEWISGPTPHRDFVASGREGVQHLRYVVDRIDAWNERLATHGYAPVWSGAYPASEAAPPIAWCYFERATDPLMIELVEFG
ncbi:MAG: hypothetical protein CALGDGBN_00533 [Pseudomonadales bacterium]|nr:hypothetical protein [Pseudomonadales bacterium]